MEDERQSTPVSTSTIKKKYVTSLDRACKKRKSKCDGREPCRRCLSSEIGAARTRVSHFASKRTEDDTQDPHIEKRQSIPPTPARLTSEGDASAHGFLRRVSDHLAKVGQGLPRSLFSREQDLLDSNDPSIFFLPPKTITQGYIDCFFDHASVTYRYIPRREVVDTFEKVYADDQAVMRDHDRMAVLLLVMATGCLCMSSWKNEPLPPWRQKSYKFLQAAETRLAKTQDTSLPFLVGRWRYTIRMLTCHFRTPSTPPLNAISQRPRNGYSQELLLRPGEYAAKCKR
ncbi:hypothetical protein CKAH01_16141 [Colletotrichum kahawae]|uniref:Zn(2)-C6 fungal-type domain-containing protein n=1 Tax=Colletotrichum kahawae TaxID=34407 RepID=A0AAD9YIG7_COLKA|nr:hypothetical protein CKAH01_16141 [Colletotrichum kahawae]